MPSVHYSHRPGGAPGIGEHVFPIGKYQRLGELLQEELGVPGSRIHDWEDIPDEDLARVHSPLYLKDLLAARHSHATGTSELPITPGIVAGFRAMCGATLAALRLALGHGVGIAIGGGFHHAFREHAEGFCYLHDMAIAVEKLRAEEGLGKVLFVDVDVHQGNGTVAIYRDDSETFCYSIHQEHNYPPKQRGQLDRGLDDGLGDEAYMAYLGEDLEAVDGRFDPELVVYVAGVDPHRDDRLGGLDLSADGLRERDRFVLERYIGRGIPVLVTLAGGYQASADATARLHLQTAEEAERAAGAR